jgi:hypothetical protein
VLGVDADGSGSREHLYMIWCQGLLEFDTNMALGGGITSVEHFGWGFGVEGRYHVAATIVFH